MALCRKHQDIYKKTTKYFNFNLPRAIQVYKIPTKHPLEHYKNNQKKQAAHWSHEDRRWQIQPGTHWEHSKISIAPTSGRGQVLLKWQKSGLLMVWIEKQLCFWREPSSSHLGFDCQSHALIFHGRRTGQELFPVFWTECGETQSPAVVWETWKSLGKASRQLWQTYKVFLHEFLSLGCWMQHVELRVTQNNLIFLCVQLQQSMGSALLNSSHGARATQTPEPGFVPVPREWQSKLEQEIQYIPGLQAHICIPVRNSRPPRTPCFPAPWPGMAALSLKQILFKKPRCQPGISINICFKLFSDQLWQEQTRREPQFDC